MEGGPCAPSEGEEPMPEIGDMNTRLAFCLTQLDQFLGGFADQSRTRQRPEVRSVMVDRNLESEPFNAALS